MTNTLVMIILHKIKWKDKIHLNYSNNCDKHNLRIVSAWFLSVECKIFLTFLEIWPSESAGLSDVPGLTIASDPLSPIVILKLKISTGSSKSDLELLNKIAERVSYWMILTRYQTNCAFLCNNMPGLDQVLMEDSVFIVSTKRSVLDKCCLPVGIRLFISAGHTESDIKKVSKSLRRVACENLPDMVWMKSLNLNSSAFQWRSAWFILFIAMFFF